MLQLVFTSLKVTLYLVSCFLVFGAFYLLETAFFTWYIQAEQMRQLVAFFVMSSLGWMIGRGINHLLQEVGRRLILNALLIDFLVNCFWLITMIFLFAALSTLMRVYSIPALCTVIFLAVELNMYPLAVRLRRDTGPRAVN